MIRLFLRRSPTYNERCVRCLRDTWSFAAEPTSIEEVSFPVARVEDLIIYKAVAWRERDRRDVSELWQMHRLSLNRSRILDVVTQFAEAIEEPNRVSELEKLLDPQ